MDTSNQNNRRDFLVKSALAGAGLTFGSSILASATTLSNQTNNNQKLNSIMKKRNLGNLEVTELGLGCMNVGWAYGTPTPKAEAVALLRKAYEDGIRFFDTAEIYGPFYSEEVVGEALKPYRNDVVIATKFGFDIDPNSGVRGGLKSDPKHIKSVVERMLKVSIRQTTSMFQ